MGQTFDEIVRAALQLGIIDIFQEFNFIKRMAMVMKLTTASGVSVCTSCDLVCDIPTCASVSSQTYFLCTQATKDNISTVESSVSTANPVVNNVPVQCFDLLASHLSLRCFAV